MDHHQSWYDFLPGYPGHGFNHIIAALLVVLTLGILSFFSYQRLKNWEDYLVPSPRWSVLNFFEVILEACLGLMRDTIGPDYKRHVPLIGSLGLFILFSNWVGLFPGFSPPTDSLNTTLACGLVVFVYFNLQGIRVHGMGHFTHLANPIGEWWGWFLMPLLLPIEVISLCVRPFSLAIRLAGNMIGDHKVLFAFAGVMPFLLPLPFFALGFLVSVIQAAVFCILSCVYISLHTQEAGSH
ncbi:MAG: F0F1 ATP synthase subunit A [Myxococcaceae bacterium]|nr:F0F1 ATP synthase subunit A [Myxococcaceae bacterium]MBH2005755.1 F0F1 ATP synthase subunit A [Myxococcaceae bacterium]